MWGGSTGSEPECQRTAESESTLVWGSVKSGVYNKCGEWYIISSVYFCSATRDIKRTEGNQDGVSSNSPVCWVSPRFGSGMAAWVSQSRPWSPWRTRPWRHQDGGCLPAIVDYWRRSLYRLSPRSPHSTTENAHDWSIFIFSRDQFSISFKPSGPLTHSILWTRQVRLRLETQWGKVLKILDS